MREEQFIYFLELLRILQKNDIARKNIEDTLIALMDEYEGHLTEMQKKTMISEFLDYEEKREQKREETRRKIEAEFTTAIPKQEFLM
ncbi:MAG: hypothetical protein HY514_02085 [Candidatus Aenigmarchaeota archaeon]|nr:hypothetical protein [Candidatus Aenigmarchaeota archaeon]